MVFIPEVLREVKEVAQKIIPIIKLNKQISPPARVKPEVSFEHLALLTSIKEKAHAIGGNVRKHGEQKFGMMWAQGYAELSDGRIVFLQQSLGYEKIDEALEINIPCSTDSQFSIHLRYNLRCNEINTFEMRHANNKPIFAYGIFDQPNQRTRIPEKLMLSDILSQVDETLQLVEIASEKIMWQNPEFTPVIRI